MDNLKSFLKGLRAKVSKKNVIVGRRQREVVALSRHYATKGVQVSVKASAKYLGFGITGGAKRPMVTIKDRITKSQPRNKNVCWLNNKNKNARSLYTMGVYPQAVYGIEGVGYSRQMYAA